MADSLSPLTETQEVLMHNVTDARDGKPVHSEHLPVPTRLSPSFTLFSVAEASSQARTAELLFLEDRVVVAPWSDQACDIVREDLFALRELLNELPEEAFVRPADPVDLDRKALDDALPSSVAIDENGTVYRKHAHGHWFDPRDGATTFPRELAAYGAKVVWTPTP